MNTTTLINHIAISPHMSVRGRLGRFVIVFLFLGLALFGDAATRSVFWTTLADAYIAVTVFVAATLLLFYSIEHVFKVDTAALLERYQQYQVPLAALLGALPGCGGAIMVMTQYSIGRIGFGAVVAVLTSTMGDAAFLLLATKPTIGLIIIAISVTVGTVSGYLVQAIHSPNFLRVTQGARFKDMGPPFAFGRLNWPWIAVLAPGLAFGVLSAFQVDIDELFAIPGLATTVGATGAVLSVALWFINPNKANSTLSVTDKGSVASIWDKTTADTCFVTVWVILAFLLFELTVHWTGWDLKDAFGTAGVFMPLFGLLIGFLPGCGPQVLTTSLYLQGIIPLSAQLANAISNDGDALFPALAVAPKAAIVATLYTAIPALIVAYSAFFFFGV
ncbi:MAG: putative manganese transporter [Pseudomonadota bacterium]